MSDTKRVKRALDALEVVVMYRINTYSVMASDKESLELVEELIRTVHDDSKTPLSVKVALEDCFKIPTIEE